MRTLKTSEAATLLFCARSGARVMALPVAGVAGLAEVVESLAPNAVVIAGSHVADDDVALWAHRVRASAGPLPMALFRRDRHGAKVRTTGARVLPDTPFGAHRHLLAVVDDRQAGRHEERPSAISLIEDADRREAQA